MKKTLFILASALILFTPLFNASAMTLLLKKENVIFTADDTPYDLLTDSDLPGGFFLEGIYLDSSDTDCIDNATITFSGFGVSDPIYSMSCNILSTNEASGENYISSSTYAIQYTYPTDTSFIGDVYFYGFYPDDVSSPTMIQYPEELQTMMTAYYEASALRENYTSAILSIGIIIIIVAIITMGILGIFKGKGKKLRR